MDQVWRLIIDGPLPGAENMALDRAIQLEVEKGQSAPTLRLYSWERPTITLGRFQSLDGIDLEACAEMGIDVVRRFTGGRGVLHDEEITYSVVARTADGVPQGVAASYRHLCRPLAEAYQTLGIEASITERDRGQSSSAACYLATTRADLSLGALKLSGSAQVWHGSTVLQHGSFNFARDIAREVRAFRLSDEQAERLASGSATLDSALGRRVGSTEVIDAVVDAFRDILGVSLAAGPVSDAEIATAHELIAKVDVEGTGLTRAG